MKNRPVIYMLKNKINGGMYIGQTVNLKRRLSEYKNPRSKSDSYILNAIRKYGWNNFEVIILHDNIPLEDLDWLEKQCIWIWNTVHPRGYNIRNGGEGGGLMSEETKKKLSNKATGFKHTKETKNRLSESQNGEKNSMYGRSHSKETREKISQKRKGFKHTEEAKRKISEARRKRTGESHMKQGFQYTNEAKRKMSEAKRGENHFLYGKSHTEESKKKMSDSSKGEKINGAALLGWLRENGLTIGEFAEYLGFDRKTVSNWINGTRGISSHSRKKWMNNLSIDPIKKFPRN